MFSTTRSSSKSLSARQDTALTIRNWRLFMYIKDPVITWLTTVALFAIAVAFGFFSLCRGQDSNWDLLNYHLANPYSFLHGRLTLDLAPAGLQSYFNPILDIPYFLATIYLSPKALGFLLGSTHGLNVTLVYKIARLVLWEHQLPRYFFLFLALTGLLTAGFLSEVGTIFNDSLIALFVLGSVCLALYSIGDNSALTKRHLSILGLAGLIMGLGCGLKLVAIIFGLGATVAILCVQNPWLQRLRLTTAYGLGVFIGLLISGGFWFYRIWLFFGNPVFPQFNHLFQGRLAENVAARDARFLPRDIFEYIFYPFIFASDPSRVAEIPSHQVLWVFSYAALLGLVISTFRRSDRPSSNPRSYGSRKTFFVAFFACSYLLWLHLFGIYRYLISIELLTPLLIFLAIETYFRPNLARPAAVFLISIITINNLRGVVDWGHSEWSDRVFFVNSANQAGLSPAPDLIFLGGQPLAWLIPALDLNSPFLQLAPNFQTSDAYWERAARIVRRHRGRKIVIVESRVPEYADRIRAGLARLGLTVQENSCTRLSGNIGKSSYDYPLCDVIVPAGQ